MAFIAGRAPRRMAFIAPAAASILNIMSENKTRKQQEFGGRRILRIFVAVDLLMIGLLVLNVAVGLRDLVRGQRVGARLPATARDRVP